MRFKYGSVYSCHTYIDRNNLSHLAIVELDDGVYGLTVIRKREEDFAPSRRGRVLSSYALSVATGQSIHCQGKLEKIIYQWLSLA